MIFAVICYGILYGSVGKLPLTAVWEFLASVLKNQDIIDFKYSDAKSKKIDQSDPLTVKWRYIASSVLFFLAIPIVY